MRKSRFTECQIVEITVDSRVSIGTAVISESEPAESQSGAAGRRRATPSRCGERGTSGADTEASTGKQRGVWTITVIDDGSVRLRSLPVRHLGYVTFATCGSNRRP
jgi:hypothetical protein